MIRAWLRRRKLARLRRKADAAWLAVGRDPSLKNLARFSRADYAYQKEQWSD